MLYMMDFWQFTYFMPGYSSASMRLWVTFMYFMSVDGDRRASARTVATTQF